jgi:type II secretory pathway component GspD/PulD (secretin)
MKRLLSALLLSVAACASAWSAQPVQPVSSFDFDSIALADLVRVVYVEALPTLPYTVDPVLLQDRRPVSFRYRPSDGDFRQVFAAFLRGVGYELATKGKLDVLRPLPLQPRLAAIDDPAQEVFVYRPRFRDGAQLIEMVSSLVTGRFSNQRSMNIDAPSSPAMSASSSGSTASSGAVVASSGSLLDLANRKVDQIIFVGPVREVAALRKLFGQLDVDSGEVVVTGVLYEVTTGKDSGSAFSLALNILGGKLGLSVGGAGTLANAVTFKSATIDAAVSALATDSRFKTVSTPRLRVRSGAQARLTVGQDVPTLGAVSYPQGGGAPVQSVEYRSSGVILGITPQVRDVGIDLHVDQQISDFVKTDTGVNGSPTLTKRSFSTDVTVADGELVVLGGLTQEKGSDARSGLSFLPKLFQSSTVSDSRTEVLLLLRVDKVIR